MSEHQERECLTVTIKGIVQGVGFRPFVSGLARRMDITGSVCNTAEGVVIHAEGANLAGFIERIRTEAPPLSRITAIETSPAGNCGSADFTIGESMTEGSFTLVSPDISICSDCKAELFTPGDRRYRYPFINCTNCGPRYSITESLPYDRANTTMKSFQMCGECEAEYHDPKSRRFHAQPNACPICGPKVALVDKSGEIIESSDPVTEAATLLLQGKIIAVKGLGGFHIACDAMNREAVSRLRAGKRRSNKPFALMAPHIDAIRRYCLVSPFEEELLTSMRRPVVLLRKRQDLEFPEEIAPGNSCLGLMLPYTPLHCLLFNVSSEGQRAPAADNRLSVLVMTSGNLAEEPIISCNDEALDRLSGLVDAYLMHDREIFMRVDDSVLRQRNRVSGLYGDRRPETLFIRRARGYVPEPIPLLKDGPDVLGCGADVKNTFTLLRGNYALMSQHLGDMENYETVCFFEQTLKNLRTVFRASPVAIACDLHPGYSSSRWAAEYAEQTGVNLITVQHHYAHIGSVMAEHGLTGKVLGIAFDGTGYGPDGSLWGGEFLVADSRGFQRAGHLRQVPLPGGEMAVREPWRMALSYLLDAFGRDVMKAAESAGFTGRYGQKNVLDILRVSEARNFSPLSSGAGRLFDAVSALTGICDINTFEGEASISLESIVIQGIDDDYPVDIHFGEMIEIDFSHMFISIMNDLNRNLDRGLISARFHNSVASAILRVVIKLSLVNNIKTVVLSGGVFQNLYLFERISGLLKEEGMAVFTNEAVPCNDACISLGQAYLLREMLLNQK